NRGKQAVVGSAVPSISPEVASLYFKKIECFCFNQQTLQPGEIKDMPIRFFVSPDLPKDIKTVTLSYSFYKVDNKPR
ncbi:MAG: cytochrome c oxidase assembly protein, partial [Methylophilaceae bacterium]|nr:cytochrome c oxidase assembly protein [Methylophilaceae bacterium]